MNNLNIYRIKVYGYGYFGQHEITLAGEVDSNLIESVTIALLEKKVIKFETKDKGGRPYITWEKL